MIETIAFWVLITTAGLWLIWELISDATKKWWKYCWMLRQDQRQGIRRKYVFSFRNGVNQLKK